MFEKASNNTKFYAKTPINFPNINYYTTFIEGIITTGKTAANSSIKIVGIASIFTAFSGFILFMKLL